MEQKIIEAIKKMFADNWNNLELGSSQADLVEAHVIEAVKEATKGDYYSKEFTLKLSIDYDNLYKFDTHHRDNWKNDIPSEAELTSSIKDEVISWLSDLRFDVVIDENDE
jgi:hypothetical protein